jgi:choline dehydrogenase-like flavoprotein
MIHEFDVVIIGSGAGGSPIAYELTKKGLSVLVLEKGPLIRPQYQTENRLSDFKRDELFADGTEKRVTLPLANKGDSFYSSHVEPDINDEPHVYLGSDNQDRATIEGYTAQVVGGGTQLYGGVSLRFSELDFKLATFNADRKLKSDVNGDVKREARDWPISYSELEKYYCKAERLIGINGSKDGQLKVFSEDNYQKPLEPNPISKYAYDGMVRLAEKLKQENKPYRTPLAVITEDHEPSGRKIPKVPDTIKSSFVNRYGCPLGLKSNTWVTLLSQLESKENFQIWPNCTVTTLESSGSKVTKVHFNDPEGNPQTVLGKFVVVACSAIESIRLLLLSAERQSDFGTRINSNGLLGKYFLTHCFGGASATMPNRADKSKALDADWAIDVCSDRNFLDEFGIWAGGAIYNNTSDQALPLSLARTHGSQDLDTLWKAFSEDTGLTGQRLADFLDRQFGTGLSISFMANQVPVKENRIELHPRITDKWNRKVAYIVKAWHSHDVYLMDVLAKQCAEILRLGGNKEGNYPVDGYGGVYQAENARARIANHILGGARFGINSKDSVLDPSCRAWGFDNLYVTDGSFMPTSGGANPTLTIQANSFRVADILKGII